MTKVIIDIKVADLNYRITFRKEMLAKETDDWNKQLHEQAINDFQKAIDGLKQM